MTGGGDLVTAAPGISHVTWFDGIVNNLVAVVA